MAFVFRSKTTSQKAFRWYGCFVFLGTIICALAFADASAQTAASISAPAVSAPVADDSYKLDAGDKVRVIVFGEPDLGGEFEVDDSGYVRLPLIGQIRAAGIGLHQFEDKVKSALEAGYLKDAKVSIEVINYRPFYILGQVNKPGEYPFVNGMSVLTAIARAGGYTYRANESDIYIRRKGGNEEKRMPADPSTKVFPGDIVRVPERFF